MSAGLRSRFVIAYVLIGAVAFGVVLLTLSWATSPRSGSRSVPPRPVVVGCSSASCAGIGDTLTVGVAGRVVAVQEPQPGVRCVTVVGKTGQATTCARAPG